MLSPEINFNSDPDTGCIAPIRLPPIVPTTDKFSPTANKLYSDPNLTVTGVPLVIGADQVKFCHVVPIPKSPKPVVIVENV
ncbi:hypothetical protein D3C86_498900 [compost metagenome]